MGVWKHRTLSLRKELEDENNRLKKMFAEMALENRAIKDLLGKL
jgi:putative transposase